MEARVVSPEVHVVVEVLLAVEPAAAVEVVALALQTSIAAPKKNVVIHWDWAKGPARPLVLVVEGFPEAEGTVRTTVIAPMVRSVVSCFLCCPKAALIRLSAPVVVEVVEALEAVKVLPTVHMEKFAVPSLDFSPTASPRTRCALERVWWSIAPM